MENCGNRVKFLIEVYGVNYAEASLTLAEKRRENRCEGHVTNQCAPAFFHNSKLKAQRQVGILAPCHVPPICLL